MMISRLVHDRRLHLLLGFAVLTGLVSVFRYDWLEDQARGLACEGSASLLCGFRQTVIDLYWNQVFGWTAFALGFVALTLPRLYTVIPAAVLTVIGLVLYDADSASVAAVMTLVALARLTPLAGRAAVSA